MIPVLADALRDATGVQRARAVLACRLAAEGGTTWPQLWTALGDVLGEYHDGIATALSDHRVVLAIVGMPTEAVYRISRELWADESPVWSALGREIECARMTALQLSAAVCEAARLTCDESGDA